MAVALGNAEAESASSVLQRILKLDPEPLIRSHVAWALGQIGGSRSQVALREALVQEAAPEVAVEIQSALIHSSRKQ